MSWQREALVAGLAPAQGLLLIRAVRLAWWYDSVARAVPPKEKK